MQSALKDRSQLLVALCPQGSIQILLVHIPSGTKWNTSVQRIKNGFLPSSQLWMPRVRSSWMSSPTLGYLLKCRQKKLGRVKTLQLQSPKWRSGPPPQLQSPRRRSGPPPQLRPPNVQVAGLQVPAQGQSRRRNRLEDATACQTALQHHHHLGSGEHLKAEVAAKLQSVQSMQEVHVVFQ